MILNITNGDAFNRYYLSTYDGEAIPFREAMMDGEGSPEIFSNRFVKLRASTLEVSEKEYRANMLVPDALMNNKYDEIALWFGKDTFCQMNLLTLLAYLEQIAYGGKVILNYIDDETFEVVEADINIELGFYTDIYEKIILGKQRADNLGVLSRKAIDLYFDYHSKNGVLSKIVSENLNREENELIAILIENSREYGLSDIQAKKIIERNKKDD